jgi:Ca2+/H+ antiporter
MLYIHIPLFFHTQHYRLSLVTEQVAEHTNGTIGALLNATFGNAPELLIATAALRSGFYRVVQLAMLGSMLTNLLFVFGIGCLVGGLRWQVQELRITSGNVSVGMLLLSTAGSLLPATLVLGGQLRHSEDTTTVPQHIASTPDSSTNVIMPPSKEELQFCRVNAFVMMFMYACYLTFQLGTHKEEFDEEDNIVQTASDNALYLSPHFTSRYGRQAKARRNLFCMGAMRRARAMKNFSIMRGRTNPRIDGDGWVANPALLTAGSGDVEMATQSSDDSEGYDKEDESDGDNDDHGEGDSSSEECNVLLPQNEALRNDNADGNDYFDDYTHEITPGVTPPLSNRMEAAFSDTSSARHHRAGSLGGSNHQRNISDLSPVDVGKKGKNKKKNNNKNSFHRPLVPLGLADPTDVVGSKCKK